MIWRHVERALDALHVPIPEPFRFADQRCDMCGEAIEWSWT